MGARTNLTERGTYGRRGRGEHRRVWIGHEPACSMRWWEFRGGGCSSSTYAAAARRAATRSCGFADPQVSHEDRTVDVPAVGDNCPAVEFFAVEMCYTLSC